MKTPIKWSKRIGIIMVIVIICSIMFTGHMMKDEVTKMGKTVSSGEYSVTYINRGKCSFKTLTAWTRFFNDSKSMSWYMKNAKMSFLAFPDDQKYALEVYIHDDYNGLSDDMLIENVQDFISKPADKTFSIISDIKSEVTEINGNKVVKSVYTRYSLSYKEYDFVVDYLFVGDDKPVELSTYSMSYDKPVDEEEQQEVEGVFESLINSFSWSDETANVKTQGNQGFFSKASNYTFSLWIFMIPLVLIFLCNFTVVDGSLKSKGVDRWQLDPLGLDNSKSILGFFAVLIVFHHLSQTIGASNSSIFAVLEHFGVGLVAAFFFFSGFGLTKSYHTKKDYLKNFFKKRFPAIIIPFYVCNFVFIIACFLSGKYTFCPDVSFAPDAYQIGWLELIEYITGFILFNTHMWYIIEIALFYAVFFLIYRFVKKEKIRLVLMGAFLTIFTLFSLSRGHGLYWFQGEWWYNSSLIFLMGMIVGEKEEKVYKSIRKRYPIWVIASIILFAGTLKLSSYMLANHGYWTETATNMHYDDKLMTLVPQLLMSVSFILLIIVILQKCRFKNKVLDFLGKISLELYLLHNVFITLFKGIRGTGVYVFAVVSCSIISAYLIHLLDTFLIRKIHGKKNVKKSDIQKANIDDKAKDSNRNNNKNNKSVNDKITDDIETSEKVILTRQEKRKLLKLRFKLGIKYIKRHPDRTLKSVFRNIVCILLCLMSVVPIFFMFINSTMSRSQLIEGLHFFPSDQFTTNLAEFNSYVEILSGGVVMALVRSCFLAGASSVLAVYFGAACAYGFELYEFKGKKILWKIVIASLMFSSVGSSIGYARMITKMHLLDSYIPLIITAIATPSAAFFMRMYMQMVKLKDIVEAARIDGSSEIGIFNRIVLPMLKPALSLLLIFTFITYWNNSYIQSLVITSPSKKTIALFLKKFACATSSGTDPVIYVLLVLSCLPPLIIYMFLSKSITSRIVIGAVKE